MPLPRIVASLSRQQRQLDSHSDLLVLANFQLKDIQGKLAHKLTNRKKYFLQTAVAIFCWQLKDSVAPTNANLSASATRKLHQSNFLGQTLSQASGIKERPDNCKVVRAVPTIASTIIAFAVRGST